jgi:putative transposase
VPYWNCYYRVVWATKYREPILTPAIQTLVYSAIRQKSGELKSPLLALNSVEDHIHIAVSIAPSLAVSSWVGFVKGLSAHAINAAFADLEAPFKWQEGYGVVTFGEKNLHFVQDYIEKQRIHHAKGEIIAKLEQMDEAD